MKSFRWLAFAVCGGILTACFSTEPATEQGVTCLTYESSAISITFRDSATGVKRLAPAFSVVGPGNDTIRADTSKLGGGIYRSHDTVYSVFGGPGTYKILYPTPSGIRESSYSALPMPGEPLGCGHAQGLNVEIRLPS